MGAIVSRAQRDRVLDFIASGHADGARLLCGGERARAMPRWRSGNFVEPTVFADVTMSMRIAREEIFGPVLSILPWSDREQMLRDVNARRLRPELLRSGPTTIQLAHRTAMDVEVGYVWINEVGKHFLGAPFGGVKQSGFGREECIEEMLQFTQLKNIHLRMKPAAR